MVHRLHNLLARQAPRGIALLTALVVLAATVGIPLPQPVAKDTSRPFPCMHHACGCMTAESCWRGCCCMSHEQKLAWAKKHGVKPPPTLAAKKACCSRGGCDQPAEPAAETAGVHVVQIDAARQCQGLTSLWMILGQALPPAECPSCESDLAPVSRLSVASAPQADSPAFDPATPPPRLAV